MGELDQGAKIALRIDPLSIVHLGLPQVQEVRPFPQEIVSAMRTTDAAFVGVLDGEEVSIQIEFEAEPTSDVGLRAVRAACALFAVYARPVRIVVFYLHPSKERREPKDRFTLAIGEVPAPILFRSVSLWELSPEDALASGLPGLLPFVALMRGATLEHVRLATRGLDRLGLEQGQRNNAEVALLLLSRTVFDEPSLRGIIRMEAVMASSILAKLQEEAEAKAEAKALRKAVEIVLVARLGSVPEPVRVALDASAPPDLELAIQIATTGDVATLEASVLAVLTTSDEV